MNRRAMAAAAFIFALAAARIVAAQNAEPADTLVGGPANELVSEQANDALSGAPDGEQSARPADNVQADSPAVEPAVDKPEKKSAKKSADKPTGPPDGGVAVETAVKPPKKSSRNSDKSAGKPAAEGVVVKEETKFKIKGLLEAGFDNNNKVNKGETGSQVIGRGEIEISARPVKKIRAEIGIEYNVRDTFVVVDKMYGQYNITKDGTIRAGFMKKSFGLEERAGIDERYFHKRSIINGELEDLGFLEHDLTLVYRHDIDSTWRFSAGVSWSLDTVGIGSSSWKAGDTMSYLQNYSIQYTPNDSMIFVLAAVVKHLNWSGATTFVSSLSFAHTAKPVEPLGIESEAEITLGSRKLRDLVFEGGSGRDDPVREVKYVRDSLILGARVQERFPINLNSQILRQIIPVVEGAAYWDNLKSEDFDFQLRAGLTFGFAKNSAFQFRNTYGRVWRKANGETNIRRSRWDSEVVVIF